MYAGINTLNNFVIDLTETEEVYGPTPEGKEVISVPIPDGVEVELGMVYDFETGEFSEYVMPYSPEPEPEPEPEPTDSEILEKIAINTEYLAAKAEMEAEA